LGNLREEGEGLAQFSARFRVLSSLSELTMARALCLLAVLSYCSGVQPQPTITQPISQSVSLGQTTRFSCSRSSGGNWEPYYRWYQQRSGEGPRFLLCNDACSRGEGVPDRFTASASGTVGYLTITSVQPEDEADYYCANWYSSGYMCHSGDLSENVPAIERHFLQELLLPSTMAWALLLLTLITYYPGNGVRSQATVTQPASQSASPGQTAKLSCTRSSAGSWSTIFCWYQQKAGQAPRYVHCNTYSRGDGIPDRFTASASGTTGDLTINNLQPEDEADYYCAVWYSTGSTSHGGTV
ncbi:hypothetical protein lerEdw1_010284, partial [Lerista edwardsae]